MSREPEPNAFPRDRVTEDPGMSLRDYFAAKAMQAMVSTYRDTLKASDDETEPTDRSVFARDVAIDQNGVTGEYEGAEEIATDAYIIADAMLAAREAK